MKSAKHDRSLESYRAFPYIAWIITIIFAFFVYTISIDLKEAVQDLQVQTQQLQEKANTSPEEIEDFEN